MIERLQRQIVYLAPAAVMSAWATVMLHTVISGHINRLLSPMFRSYVVIAGAALMILSLLHLMLYRPSLEPVPSPWRQIGRWIVLLVPVIGASVLSPAALSNTTAQLRSSSTAGVAALPRLSDSSAENVKQALNTDAGVPAPMEVTDLITVSHSPDMIRKFDGRPVHVIGLFAGGDPPKLMRWIMWCCAADAQPASVALNGDLGGSWKDQQWLDVIGTAHFPTSMGQAVPQIDVTRVKKTDEPDEPFLSP